MGTAQLQTSFRGGQLNLQRITPCKSATSTPNSVHSRATKMPPPEPAARSIASDSRPLPNPTVVNPRQFAPSLINQQCPARVAVLVLAESSLHFAPFFSSTFADSISGQIRPSSLWVHLTCLVSTTAKGLPFLVSGGARLTYANHTRDTGQSVHTTSPKGVDHNF